MMGRNVLRVFVQDLLNGRHCLRRIALEEHPRLAQVSQVTGHAKSFFEEASLSTLLRFAELGYTQRLSAIQATGFLVQQLAKEHHRVVVVFPVQRYTSFLVLVSPKGQKIANLFFSHNSGADYHKPTTGAISLECPEGKIKKRGFYA